MGSTPICGTFELLYLFYIFIYMGRKQKKYHYIYKTTNVINDKYYIGMHSTDNLNDGYIGSGKRLWYSINYHGKENHVCEILEYCDNRKELSKREEEIVNEQLLSEDLCLNLVTGGHSGQQGFVNDEHRIKMRLGASKWLKDKYKTDEIFKNLMAESRVKNMKNYHKLGIHNYNTFGGKKHTEETIKKIKNSKRGQGKGETNSQYGKCWITNENENKKIMRGDEIPQGWRLGRVMK